MIDRIQARVPVDAIQARLVAVSALKYARINMPKLTGSSARRMLPVHGEGLVGVRWLDPYVWFQEAGIRGFTMAKVAGKVIPMWIDDPTGEEARNNPKAKKRVTESGKRQVLIFRRAGTRNDPPTSTAHWPGQPGRISFREAARPYTATGRVGGRIARGNVGVWWRNPGWPGRHFIFYGLVEALEEFGLPTDHIEIGENPRMAA